MLPKRAFDIACALLGLFVLSPLFMLIAVVIKLDSGGEIFFRQLRVGRYGQEFSIHKFRTMTNDINAVHNIITVGGDKRITRVGRILRKTKLDELPQLIDVLLGKMSLVGPRPEVWQFVSIYPYDVGKKILSVRPGITDWASIKMIDESMLLARSMDPKQTYINEILPLKLDYALKYIDTRSFFQDIVILVVTVFRVFIRY